MTLRKILVVAAALLAMSAASGGAWAQEVVQPLPPQGAQALNEALRRLADNPRDVSALVDAGEAALKVGDIEGAMGFFGRARDISPTNARVKLGMATAFARSRRPVEALRLFAEAEAAGADRFAMAADRGLAFDLVGDAASAQANYRLAISRSGDPELVRRLALNRAIARDKSGFEATLLPLLKQGDLAAYRTRAFGLAILGEIDAAIEIARNMMPPQMAARMTPYLRYMPQLTQAEQAAAGNLGIFPRAASLTSADPPSRVDPRSAGARLAPSGAPMGSTASRAGATPDPRAIDRRRRPDRTNSRTVRVDPPADIAREGRAAALDAATRAPTPEPAPSGRPAIMLPAATSAPAPTAVRVAALPPAIATPEASAPVIVAQAPAETGSTEAPTVSANPDSRPFVTLPPVGSPESEISLAEAFASFTLPGTPAPSASVGAVDITAIRIPREIDRPEPPKPAKPLYPSRHWVQVATGKNVEAFAFDWRRIAKQAEGELDGKGPFTTPWVEANRLLSGPYDSAADAREMVKRLRDLGIDSFTFTSAAGEEIRPLE